MTTSLVISAFLMMASAFSSSWNHFLVYRALQGAAFSGLPAVAMAYMGEEVDPRQRGYAVGLYVSGAAFGGMAGRVISGLLADAGGWRLSIAAIGALGFVTAILFFCALPASRHFHKQPIRPGTMLVNYWAHACNPTQRALYLLGFLFMGSLVSTYNYLGYRLIAPPFSLSHTLIGLLFTIYLVGIASSTIAGSLADSFGRSTILIAAIIVTLAGLLLISVDQVIIIICGLVVFTGGFFAAHSVASGWVGANANSSKAQASSLYLFFYYSGGALFGWAGGLFWEIFHWHGVAAMVGSILIIALATAFHLRRLS